MASKRQSTTSTSISYQLFMHLEELRRPKQQPLRLNKSKVQLTTLLIIENVQNIRQCSIADLQAINRVIVFKEELRKQIQSMKVALKQTAGEGKAKGVNEWRNGRKKI